MRRLMFWTATLILWSPAVPAQAQAQDEPGLTLAEALRRAELSFEDFSLADEELLRARVARERAWAAVVPSFAASGTFTHSDRQVEVNDRVLQRQDSLAGTITGSLRLLDGPRVAGVVQSHRVFAASEHATQWTRNELAFEVARAFFAALAAENLVRAAERTRITAQEYVEAVRARRAAGAAVGVDEERARIELIAAEEQVIRARNAAEGSSDYLAFLIGEEPPMDLSRPLLPDAGDASVEAVPDAPERPRPDQLALQDEVRAARSAVAQAWLDYLPTLTLTGTYRASQNTGWSGTPHSWQLVLTLDWTIFDGGLRRAVRRERASELRSSELRQRRLDREVGLEIRGARRDLTTALATIRTATERLRLTRETRALVLRQYRAGLTTSLELIDADDSQQQADVNLVARELELALTWLELNRALGLDPLGQEVAR